ncbi:MAG: cupredoxin domain-containing protein [Solirubrobacteraceae bacterium]
MSVRVKSLILPVIAAAVVLAVALAVAPHRPAPGGASSTSSASVSGGATAVQIKNYNFAPDTLTVKVGTKVTWTNHDATAHTATADGGSFDTGTLNQGQSKTIVFMRPGTFSYHCIFHAFMTGTIKVVS